MIPTPYITLAIGFTLMFSSFFTMNYDYRKASIILLIIGAIISFASLPFLPNYDKDFCENNEGVYDNSREMKICSILNDQGEYIIHKVIKVHGERELAKFARVEQ